MCIILAELHRGKFWLWVQCEGCGDMNTLSPFELIGVPESPGADPAPLEGVIIAEAAARLRCKRCGSRKPKWTRKRAREVALVSIQHLRNSPASRRGRCRIWCWLMDFIDGREPRQCAMH